MNRFSNNKNSLGFEVWVLAHAEDSPQYSCVASFYFWQECLDYKDYAISRAHHCFIRTLNPDRQTFRTEGRGEIK